MKCCLAPSAFSLTTSCSDHCFRWIGCWVSDLAGPPPTPPSRQWSSSVSQILHPRSHQWQQSTPWTDILSLLVYRECLTILLCELSAVYHLDCSLVSWQVFLIAHYHESGLLSRELFRFVKPLLHMRERFLTIIEMYSYGLWLIPSDIID